MVKTKNSVQVRKALQTLQPSINDENILVGSSGSVKLKSPVEKKPIMSQTDTDLKVNGDRSCSENTLKESEEPLKLRRSERNLKKKAKSDIEVIYTQKLPAIVSPKPKKKKVKKIKKVVKKKLEIEVKEEEIEDDCFENSEIEVPRSSVDTSCQAPVDAFNKCCQAAVSFSSDKVCERTLSSSQDESCNESSDALSIGPDLMYLVTDDEPEHYWKELAEERQKAIEDTLRENESLQDQLTVLQAENELLMSVVDSARELSTYLVRSIDEEALPLTKEEISSLFDICKVSRQKE